MGDVKHVTDQDFEAEVIGSGTAVLVDFWAEWCVPCHMVSPVVEEIGREKAGALSVVKLNIDENPEVTRRYSVMSIPTLIVFQDGQPVKRMVGAKGKGQLLEDLGEFL